jgi:hypothetical protein
MTKERKELIVVKEEEYRLMNNLVVDLLEKNHNSENTTIVAVSTDYSSMIGQYLRHQLSINGEICSGFGVDVPYPDQEFDQEFEQAIVDMFSMYYHDWSSKKYILLVEAGVIRGGNYTKIVEILRKNFQLLPDRVITLTMYENIHSKFKSNFVGEYYDNETQDLTFWWENYNKHWD